MKVPTTNHIIMYKPFDIYIVYNIYFMCVEPCLLIHCRLYIHMQTLCPHAPLAAAIYIHTVHTQMPELIQAAMYPLPAM